MTARGWVGVGLTCWTALLVALLALLLPPGLALEPPDQPALKPERIQVLTCTAQVATVDAEGITHIETIDCKEE